jgi:hypothetical protein
MAGRPSLRIGQHGRINRIQVDTGVWVARCRYRDTDGVTRIVERRSPVFDQHGKLAEDELVEALSSRRAPGGEEVHAVAAFIAARISESSTAVGGR